jgi:hypothetical protein
MRIEQLEKVAVAAGYAMAPDEEREAVQDVLTLSASSEPREVTAWRSVQSKLKPAEPAAASATSWLRGALGGFGRGAPA